MPPQGWPRIRDCPFEPMQLLEEADRRLILAPRFNILTRFVFIDSAQVELFVSAFKYELPAARIADLDEFIDGESRIVVQARRQTALLLAGFDGCIRKRHAAVLHHIANSVGRTDPFKH